MNWRCMLLPWHRLGRFKKLSRDADYFRCSCGREYAMHHEVRCVVPWSAVRGMYE